MNSIFILDQGWYLALQSNGQHVPLDVAVTTEQRFVMICEWLKRNWPGHPVLTLQLREGLGGLRGDVSNAHGSVLGIEQCIASSACATYSEIAMRHGFDCPYFQVTHSGVQGQPSFEIRVWLVLNLTSGVAQERARDDGVLGEGSLVTA